MKKIIITSSLIVINILAIIGILVHYNKPSNSYSEQTLSASTIPDSISIMIQSSAGSTTYTKSTSETWPDSTKYHLNQTKSYCKNGSTYNLNGSKVSVNLNRADDCWFYFDLGANVTFTYSYEHMYSYIGGLGRTQEYTNNQNSYDIYRIHVNNTGVNVSQVCLSETNDISSCKWQDIRADKSDGYCTGATQYCDRYNLQFSGEDGLKTIYAYIKDTSGNVYGPVTQNVTLDTVSPVVQMSVASNGITISPSDNIGTIGAWYVKSNGSSAEYKSYSGTIPLAVGTYVPYVWDKAGNQASADPKNIVALSTIPGQTIYAVTTVTCVCDATSCWGHASTVVGATYCSVGPSQSCGRSNTGASWVAGCGVAGSTTGGSTCPSGSTRIGSTNFCLSN